MDPHLHIGFQLHRQPNFCEPYFVQPLVEVLPVASKSLAVFRTAVALLACPAWFQFFHVDLRPVAGFLQRKQTARMWNVAAQSRPPQIRQKLVFGLKRSPPGFMFAAARFR
jgi:hypothetical protein